MPNAEETEQFPDYFLTFMRGHITIMAINLFTNENNLNYTAIPHATGGTICFADIFS